MGLKRGERGVSEVEGGLGRERSLCVGGVAFGLWRDLARPAVSGGCDGTSHAP